MIIKEYIVENTFDAGYCVCLAEVYADTVEGSVTTYLNDGAVHVIVRVSTSEDVAFIEKLLAAVV